ncbi:apoptosis-antagonizing transcription factor, C-terminal-domain containing protein [Nitzschia inconspicua]|uniref:Apoptosis-antagonizing transcription factor, C-terminal-domain containing protein n=1 Tax=Nitzschia inconspicua TaxID=303405 RepID=A0A9K3LI09_9STRA|nr:apoptosis-antagonizing transcription factor, C-terminal-domain containing protein [Nitzschia inconspicua]
MGKKRDVSVFDAIDELETQDRRADGKRHKQHRADQQRAQQVYQQTQIYQHLVESRILLQRAIVANTKDTAAANVTSSSSPSESPSPSVSSKTKFRDTCNELLEQLLLARNQLSGVGNAQDKKNFYKNIILSAESSSQLSKMLQEEHEQHREQWRRILNQRHKSLRLHSGVTSAKSSQFRVMDASFWEQVEATVEYEKLRTNNNNNNNTVTLLDDSKVYQQLLKDFVASHAQQTGTEAAAAAAERLRMAQRKSNKEKNKLVDRRASKGRKLRYKEIPKLVNFTFPLSRSSTTSNLQQDEYFQSLFGGAAAVTIQGQTKL